MTPWYEELFRDYGEKYDGESFAQGTAGECDFIEKEIAGDRQTRILDIGCGTGRHALELARRGYAVVGIDLSASLLKKAEEKAAAAGLHVDFRRGDARELPFASEFGLVVMLCEGAFPLMETDEMNFRILAGAARALKPGGKLIFTTLNGLFPLHHSLDEFFNAGHKEGDAAYGGHHFDLMTFRARSVTTVVDDRGRRKELRCDERYYVPSEITWLLKSLGFGPIGIFGATLGAFSRADRLQTDDLEMLVVADK
jgi:SAM-dependent methyltransferase